MEEQCSLEMEDTSIISIVVNYRQTAFTNGPGPLDKGTIIKISKWSTIYMKLMISKLDGP